MDTFDFVKQISKYREEHNERLCTLLTQILSPLNDRHIFHSCNINTFIVWGIDLDVGDYLVGFQSYPMCSNLYARLAVASIAASHHQQGTSCPARSPKMIWRHSSFKRRSPFSAATDMHIPQARCHGSSHLKEEMSSSSPLPGLKAWPRLFN